MFENKCKEIDQQIQAERVENDEFEKLQLLSLEDYHELEDTVEEKVKVNALEEELRRLDPGYFLQSNE